MKKKIVGICVCLLVIATALPSLSAVNEKQKTTVWIEPIDVQSEYGKIEGKKLEMIQPGLSNPIGEPAFTGPEDQLHPTIVRTESGILGAVYWDNDIQNCSWATSTDDGATWTQSFTDTIPYDYPSSKLWAEDRVFITALPAPIPEFGYGGNTLLVDIPDMNTPMSLFPYAWWWNATSPEYNYGFHHMIDCDLACDDSQSYEEYGLISCIMSKTNDQHNLINIPFMQWADPTQFPTVWGYWLTSYQNCSHTDCVIDPVKVGNYRWMYSVYDWYDTSSNLWKLILVTKDFEQLVSGLTLRITGIGNLQCPAISVYNHHLIILAETDENGNKDIICLYSDNGWNNIQTSFVVSTSLDERYPDIRHIQDTTFLCTFVSDNTLYKSITEDGGATWSTPEAIDTEVVEEYKTSDLSEYAMKTLYEVDKGDDIDLYYSEVSEGPRYPQLNITSITGGLGITTEVKNTGDCEATNVTTTITVTGGILKKINTTVTDIASLLAIDDVQSVKTGMFIGFGKITITVSSECAEGKSCTQTKEGFQLFIFSIVK
jgi:hypothetical protein